MATGQQKITELTNKANVDLANDKVVVNNGTSTYNMNVQKIVDAAKSINVENIFVYAANPDLANSTRLIPVARWSLLKSTYSALGIAVKSGRDIIIVSLEETKNIPWSTANVTGGGYTVTNKRTAINDYAGETNAAAQAQKPECSGSNCAVGWCHAYSSVDANNNGIPAGSWWLPSCGELFTVYGEIEAVNYALEMVGGTPFNMNQSYLTSTESNSERCWFLQFTNGSVDTPKKSSTDYRVRAVSTFR